MTLRTTRRALLSASALALPTIARAQAWPTRSITILVPNPPGGGSDCSIPATTPAIPR
jgi:tripartite-type tricarboxylate transporter receptor subunit TctC